MTFKKAEKEFLDPVFLKYGLKVYTYAYIQTLRKENLERIRNGKKIINLIPQSGFQEDSLLLDADIKIIGGKRGGGKVLPNDADIITPFGVRKNGDLKIGSILSNPTNGGMEKVIAIYEHPNHDFYELQFDDGSSVECGLEHLWKVRQTGYAHKRRLLSGVGYEDDYRIWTFGMIKEWLDKQNDGQYVDRKEKSVSKKHLVIPLTEPVKFTITNAAMRKRPRFSPYVIGALIGDGCMTADVVDKGVVLLSSSADDVEIQNAFSDDVIDMTHIAKDKRSNGVSFSIYDKDLIAGLKTVGLAGCRSENKFIPYCYKYANVEDRWAVVQGLMDTDGTIDGNGKTISYCTVSKQLAEDFQFIIRSLGGSAKITTKKSFYLDSFGKRIDGKPAYNVHIRINHPERLFRLKRKKERCKAFNGGASEVARRIVGYRYVGKKDGRCITVDDANSLYLTNDFIVTHNTWLGLFEFLPYMFNPDVFGYGFRRFEDDIARGIWRSLRPVFKPFGTLADSYFSVSFLNGRGATFKCEHLQDPKKITDRFRGVEMAYILIEELAEHTRESLNPLFDLLTSNRSTAGVRPKCVCTCNPVGKSNKLRYFLDWYIDPQTDTIIPDRDGKIRYFYRYGDDVTEIAWGNTPMEVYLNPSVKDKIDHICRETGQKPENLITSLVFIEGGFSNNLILQAADPKYMNRISARGGESTSNDILGVWRDVDNGSSLISADEMLSFFGNSERRDGTMRASADVALDGDFFVIYALDGHHVCDMEAWVGMLSDDVPSFIENFLRKNGVRKENFTFDANGLGMWLKRDSRFDTAVPFNNRSSPSDVRMWNNLKSECAEKFVNDIKHHVFSIDENILKRKLRDKKGRTFTVKDRLLAERMAIKRKNGTSRFEIIDKSQMKNEVGHSPDFIEGLFMVEHLFEGRMQTCIRTGFESFLI